MRVDVNNLNPAFVEMIKDPDQIIFLDANIFIPPDRSGLQRNVGSFKFEDYKLIFLDPLIQEFPKLAVHETVYKEIVADSVKSYVDSQIEDEQSHFEVHYDKNLTDNERALLQLFISTLAVHSGYDPVADNAKDRGEIRSLAYMAVKKYLYFAANDALPIRLIKNAEELNTSLDGMGVVQPYELIYFLYEKKKYDRQKLRLLYKYMYCARARERIPLPCLHSLRLKNAKQMQKNKLCANTMLDIYQENVVFL